MKRTRDRIRPRVVHEDCGWDCACPSARARQWAPIPKAKLTWPEWEVLSHLLAVRSGACCEGCGRRFVPGEYEANRHHRHPQSMGGTDDLTVNGLANLMLLGAGPSARLGGTDERGCHAKVESHREWAESRGLLVPWGAYTGEGEPPEVTTPVTLPNGRRVLLDPINPFYLDVPAAA